MGINVFQPCLHDIPSAAASSYAKLFPQCCTIQNNKADGGGGEVMRLLGAEQAENC